MNESPAVDGNIVVWVDYRSGNSEIYGYNLLSQKEFLISPTLPGERLGTKANPLVTGDVVIWNEFIGSRWGLVGYNLTEKRVIFRIARESGDLIHTSACQNYLAYIENRPEGWPNLPTKLFVLDLLNLVEREIDPTTTSIRVTPTISYPWLAWCDNRTTRNTRGNVFVMNLRTKQILQATKGAGEYSPHIVSDPNNTPTKARLVWSDTRNGDNDIYGADIDLVYEVFLPSVGRG